MLRTRVLGTHTGLSNAGHTVAEPFTTYSLDSRAFARTRTQQPDGHNRSRQNGVGRTKSQRAQTNGVGPFGPLIDRVRPGVLMLDLVSVIGGAIRTEDLPDVVWETWFARPAVLTSSAAGSSTLGRALSHVRRRGWLVYGLCAIVIAGTTLLKRG